MFTLNKVPYEEVPFYSVSNEYKYMISSKKYQIFNYNCFPNFRTVLNYDIELNKILDFFQFVYDFATYFSGAFSLIILLEFCSLSKNVKDKYDVYIGDDDEFLVVEDPDTTKNLGKFTISNIK